MVVKQKSWGVVMKARIVKRENVDKTVEYVIQQKHFIFRWWWVDAWVNSFAGAACNCSFESLEMADKNMCYFDGSKEKDTVVGIY
jgi:hypothetical protein